MAGELVTNNYQFEFNGVAACESSNIEVVSIDIFTSPEVRIKKLDRPLDHGSFNTKSYYSYRTIDVEIEVWGQSEIEFQKNLVEALKLTELTDTEVPFVCQLPGFGKIRLNAKCSKRAPTPVDLDYSIGYKSTIVAEYVASNPRILSDNLNSTIISKSVASGGLDYNLNYDLFYGTSGTGGTTITNTGSFETRPVIVVVGPLNGFNLENVTSGKKLSFNGNLGDGDNVVIDFLNRSVLLDGTASRYSWVEDVTQWWTLIPGNNDIRLNGSSAGSPTATVQWRNAWM